MPKKIVAIFLSILLLISVLYVYRHFYPQPSPEIHYYFSAFSLSAAILIIIWFIRVVSQLSNKKQIILPKKYNLNGKNRRKTYRLSYPHGTEPTLQVIKCNDNSSRSYLLKIVNLSEDGAKIQHNGLLKKKDDVSGHIVFSHGDKFEIIGKVIHIFGSNANMQFKYSLPSKLLIAEQRRLMSLNH